MHEVGALLSGLDSHLTEHHPLWTHRAKGDLAALRFFRFK
jgi:hypothetical protein